MKRLVAVLAVVLAAAAFWAFTRLSRPYAAFRQPVLLDFSRGTSTTAIAQQLQRNGVVENATWFLLARALYPRAKLQAGEYEFSRPASPIDIVSRLAKGDVHYYELVIPEGATIFDIAKLAEGAGVGTAPEFLKEARNPKNTPDVDAAATSLEGYLFPATYRFTKGTTPAQLCRMMVTRFNRAWSELNAPRENAHRIVTLASLVEKEAASPADRPLIASVFQNRLQKGMTLDCDPTVVYAALLEGKYRGTIYRSDLDRKSAYNTYRVAGLPPGPIANPGIASLKAALDPAHTDYLYFVARPDGSGTHVFSKTLTEHNKAVLQYRRGQKSQQVGSASPPGGRTRTHSD